MNKFKITNTLKIIATIIIAIGIFCAGFFLQVFSSFEPVRIKNEIYQCNDWYTTMKYLAGLKKFDSMVLTAYNKCQSAREAKNEKDYLVSDLQKKIECVKSLIKIRQEKKIQEACFKN